MIWKDPEWAEYKWAMLDFYSRPYWTRLWVVQEFLLAKNIVILCGDHELDWSAFDNLLKFGKNVGHLDAADLVRLRNEWRCGSMLGPITFPDILEFCYDLGCRDPRDRIFGIQGLISAEERVKVDYSIANSDLFHQVSSILTRKTAQFGVEGQGSTIPTPRSVKLVEAALSGSRDLESHRRSRRPRANGYPSDRLGISIGQRVPWYY